MNPDHLGDALDHWKADLLGRLLEAGVVRDLGVVGMFTGAWTTEAVAAYSRLLRVPDLVLRDRSFPGKSRKAYWRDLDEAWPDGDLFLDPDTGIAAHPSPRHVTVDEIRALTQGSDRLVIVYQHRWRTKDPVEAIRAHAAGSAGQLAVWSGQAGMVCASTDPGRIERAEAWLKELYAGLPGRVARLWG